MSMASKLATSSIQQQPPAYILQSWRREQSNLHDTYLLQQTFIIAPDTSLPFSRLRQRIRNIYEERIQPRIVVHHDPWEKKSQIQTIRIPTKDLVKNHTTL